MNFINAIFANTFVAFLILISIVVIAHELGHFLAGRLLGIDVEEFAIGFGPKIFSFKMGRTVYRVNWFLLGGYVRFYGADLENKTALSDTERERSILHAKLFKRMIVSFAGPFANFVLSLFIMMFVYAFGMTKQPAIFRVLPHSVAHENGLRSGDKILSIDGKSVQDWSSMMQIVAFSPEKPLQIEIERINLNQTSTKKTFTVTPVPDKIISPDGTTEVVGRVGITPFFSEPVIAPWQNQFFSQIGLIAGDKILKINSFDIKTLDQVVEYVSNVTKSSSDIDLAKAILKKDKTLYKSVLHFTILRNGLEKNLDVEWNSPKLIKWAEKILHKSNASQFSHKPWLQSVASDELTILNFGTNLKEKTHSQIHGTLQDCGIQPGDTIRQINDSRLFASQIDLYSWLETETKRINQDVKLFKNNSIPTKILTTNPNGIAQYHSCFLPIQQQRNAANKEILAFNFPVQFIGTPFLYPALKVKSHNVFENISMAFHSVITQTTFIYVGFKKLFSGNVPLASLGGPIAIAGFAGEAAKAGFETFLIAMSLISINIGIFNLLPLPMLDGGTLLLQFVELLYRKPIPQRLQIAIMRFGIALLLTLFVFVFYNDIVRLFS